jgi:hypothetical protein
MRFRLLWRGQCLEVVMEREATTYRLLEGPGLHVVHEDRKVLVTKAAPVSLPTGYE